MQQINFYLPEFQPNREPFRSSQILWLLLVMILLLTAVTIKTYSDNKKIAKNIEQDSLQAQTMKSRLQEFATSKTQVNIVDLDNQISKIKHEIARRIQLLQLISYQRLGNDQGFSAQLEAMARQSNPQISLEIFSIKQGGSYVEFVGKTTSADKLPAYIHSLKSEEDFRNVSFGVVKIEPVKDRSGYLQFVLAEPIKELNEQVSAVQAYLKETGLKKGVLP
jgi:Tfp pilus assembly protein PilN